MPHLSSIPILAPTYSLSLNPCPPAHPLRRQGEGGSSVADFLRQVGYREYSRYLSFHFPFTHERSLLEHLRAVPWKFDQRLFKVRCAGQQILTL